jgi:hypothetical protein
MNKSLIKSKYNEYLERILKIQLNFSQGNLTFRLKCIIDENKHTKPKQNPRSIEIQKVLQNVKKYCKITDDSSDEQLLEYITKNTPSLPWKLSFMGQNR